MRPNTTHTIEDITFRFTEGGLTLTASDVGGNEHNYFRIEWKREGPGQPWELTEDSVSLRRAPVFEAETLVKAARQAKEMGLTIPEPLPGAWALIESSNLDVGDVVVTESRHFTEAHVILRISATMAFATPPHKFHRLPKGYRGYGVGAINAPRAYRRQA